MRKNSPATDRAIHAMVRRIVRQFRPERVILFGSHARGEAGPDFAWRKEVVGTIEYPAVKEGKVLYTRE